MFPCTLAIPPLPTSSKQGRACKDTGREVYVMKGGIKRFRVEGLGLGLHCLGC